MSKHTGIPIGVDDTDHIAFFCPNCGKAMTVSSVGASGPPHNQCTHIFLRCACGTRGQRKFYHTTDDGKYCTHRTDGETAMRPERTDSARCGKVRWTHGKAETCRLAEGHTGDHDFDES